MRVDHPEHGHSHGSGDGSSTSPTAETSAGVASTEPSTAKGGVNPLTTQTSRLSRHTRDSMQSLYGHPAQTRQAVVQAAEEYCASEGALNGDGLDAAERGEANILETSVKLENSAAGANASQTELKDKIESDIQVVSQESAEPAKKANHSQSKKNKSGHSHGHGHSHGGDGSMNIRGVIIHIFGDALGSLAVVVSGLIIWLTPFTWRFYFDPLFSLIIVIIILFSAVPLGRRLKLECHSLA
jgi:zinc transporter 1